MASEDDDLIHFRDITEPGVYQPIVPGSIKDLYPGLYDKYKLVVIPNGAIGAGLVKIWKNTIGNVSETGAEISTNLFSHSEEQLIADRYSRAGYTDLMYRKCNHLEFFVGVKLKE